MVIDFPEWRCIEEAAPATAAIGLMKIVLYGPDVRLSSGHSSLR
jgi:hypothetical protein